MSIYSQTNIEYATEDQRRFYNVFRDYFLKGTYLDIEGNSNYAFILLFDLLEDYESHQDLSLLESQYEKLKLICPKTESYCSTLLMDLMESMGDYIGAERIKTQYYKNRDETSEERTAAEFVEGMNTSERELITSEEQTAAEFVEDANSVNDISTTQSLNADESVIDVTGSYAPISYDSTNEDELTQYDQVPKWEHMSIYSQTNIEYVTEDQRRFYNVFRDSFLKGTYLDIEGNSNYAFILLFDLLEDYESHQDLSLLESQYEKLKLICPKTESYCSTLLTDLMESMGDYIGAERIKTQYYKDQDVYFGNDYRTLGKKYEKEPKPSKNEAAERSLNAISRSCWKGEFKKITSDFDSSGLSSFVDRICSLAELNDQNPASKNIYFKVAKHFRSFYPHQNPASKNIYFKASKYLAKKDRLASIEMYLRYLHLDLHSKAIENKQHTKKTKEALFSTEEQLHEFQKIVGKLIADKDLKTALDAVPSIYEPRKKIELDQSEIQKAQAEQTETVNMLNELENEPINEYTNVNSSKNIYFKASKYLAKKDRLASIEMYLRYLHLDLHSKAIENKQHTKKTKEALFSTEEQLHEFQKIVGKLIADKDLKTALDAVPRIYAPRKKKENDHREFEIENIPKGRKALDAVPSIYEPRKKIELDQSKIQKAQTEQTKTVNMLNELENESINEYTKIKENDHREFEIENIPKGRKALDAVPRVYEPRKKIELDQSKIQKAQTEQTKTVNMLNELENEFINEYTKIEENDHREFEIESVPESMNSSSVTISPSIALGPVHIEMLELFEKSAPEDSLLHDDYFKVSARDLDKFAESNEMFKNQLIDRINDICSELLDDEVLIEEDGENFMIYKPYCEKIYKQMNDNGR